VVRPGSRVVESASSLRVFPLLYKFCGLSGLPMETRLTDIVFLKTGDLFCGWTDIVSIWWVSRSGGKTRPLTE